MQACNFEIEKLQRQTYSLESFEIDALDIYQQHPTAPKRGGALTGKIRKYKTSECLLFLLPIHGKEGIDMTPMLAKRLLQGLFGRSVRFDTLVAVYGDKNRSASHKSDDFKRLEELVERYKPKADALSIQITLDTRAAIKRAQEEYKQMFKDDPQDDDESED
jgi:hypothetical protein